MSLGEGWELILMKDSEGTFILFHGEFKPSLETLQIQTIFSSLFSPAMGPIFSPLSCCAVHFLYSVKLGPSYTYIKPYSAVVTVCHCVCITPIIQSLC